MGPFQVLTGTIHLFQSELPCGSAASFLRVCDELSGMRGTRRRDAAASIMGVNADVPDNIPHPPFCRANDS